MSLLVRERDDPEGRERLLKLTHPESGVAEAALLTALDHPRIPRVLEVGRTAAGGQPFLLREFVAGEPLDQARVPVDGDALVDLAEQILELLGYMHLRGVLHLDLKPANLIRDPDGHVHIVDFGLGRRLGSIRDEQGGSWFFGAPEVLLGSKTLDARADLFGVGAILVALSQRTDLAGFLNRFPARPFLEAAHARLDGLPTALQRLIRALVHRQLTSRPPDAQAALELLRGRQRATGRPGLELLELDPTQVFRTWLDEQVREARELPGRDWAIHTDAGQQGAVLGLALAAELADVDSIDSQQQGDDHRVILRRGGGPTRVTRPPHVSADLLVGPLTQVLGLDAGTALAASRQLLRGLDAPNLQAVTRDLRERALRGELRADGPGWIWPDAAAGRALQLESHSEGASELEQPPHTADLIRQAAESGRVFLAENAYRELANRSPAREPELRSALARGLLRCGEPGRALPLTHDLPELRARALLDLGQAKAAADAIRSLPEATSDEVRRMLAMARHLQGDLDGALAVAESLTNPTALENRICRGSLLAAAGRHPQAEELLRSAADELDAASAPYLRAMALGNLGEALRSAGDLPGALAAHREARDSYRLVGHLRHAATASSNLGVVAKDMGNHDVARHELRTARALFEQVGDALGAALAEANLGIACLAAGDPAAAIEHLDRALPEVERLGVLHATPLIVVHRALAQARSGRADAARADLATLREHEPSPRVRKEMLAVEACLEALELDPPADESTNPPPNAMTAPSPPSDAIPRAVFRTVLAVNRRLATERDLERAMQHLLDTAQTVSGARSGYLLIEREGTVRVEIQSDSHRKSNSVSRSLANKAISEQRTMTATDALADRSLAEMPSVRNLRQTSAVCVPFECAAGVRGALYVEHDGRDGAFASADIELLEALADQAALAVDRRTREEELSTALERSERELTVAKRSKARARSKQRLLGRSAAMQEVRQQIDRLGRSDLAVLVLGETGSGKELVARELHDRSARSAGPFVSENCSAIPENLVESELFGHVRGAFTGADRDKPGLFELADGGTLFLDEVGDMPTDMQVKLLRVLQEGAVRRVGDSTQIAVDVRLVTATHRDPERMIEAAEFRQDLYYRIAAGVLRVPPLRDREDDVIQLAEHFVAEHGRKEQREIRIGDHGRRALREWRWPGNVRELEHVIARAVVLSDGEFLDLEFLPRASETAPAAELPFWPVLTIEEATRRSIRAALRHTGGDKTAAAKLLGISRTALYDRLRRDPEIESGT